MGSSWKIALIFPLICIAVIAISCSEKNDGEAVFKVDEDAESAEKASASLQDDQLFFVVDEMPTFNGGEPIEFRKYIARNLKYPEEAKANGITGKVFIKFVVTKTGKVVIPDQDYLAGQMEGKISDEVVVVAYRPLKEGNDLPDEKYIQMFKDEVIRVISQSPDWEPGKQKGKNVKVMFTFPVSFTLQ
jgi:protein TonB